MTQRWKDPGFRTLDAEERNGGMPPAALADSYLTPVTRLFIRSHAASPVIDPAAWRVAVTGLVQRSLTLSVDDLETRFPRRELVATLVCAGIRREEFLRLGPLPGELPWATEPVATCRWEGVSLRNLLELAGVDPEARHVGLTGGDEVERHGERFGFGGSITIAKAGDPDVLVATRLDGRPLPVEHGFPVRLVVPGWIGARSVKWLREIELRREPSANYFQTRAYRVQRQIDPADPRDVSAGDALADINLNAVILTPIAGSVVPAGGVEVSGWAIGPGGSAPARVELSGDGGATWREVDLLPATDRWTWRLWRARPILGPGTHQLVVRAWDGEGRTQPASIEETWNVKGYMNNAWHRVAIEVIA